jgi:hypothetical protein
MDDEGHEAEMIECVESWHLPSVNDADDGRHVIHMKNVILEDEQYTYTRFPFVFMTWGDACVGFAGISLAEQLKNIQMEINKLALEDPAIYAPSERSLAICATRIQSCGNRALEMYQGRL